MPTSLLFRLSFVLSLGCLVGVIATPSQYLQPVLSDQVTTKLERLKVTLGLDLAGGTELDYRIDLSDAQTQNQDDDPNNDVNLELLAESVRDAIEARVNPAGIGEIIVKRSQINDKEHILVQMPPSSNVEQAKRDAEKDNRLEFFAEDPQQIASKRVELAELLTVHLTPENWDEQLPNLESQAGVQRRTIPNTFLSDIVDQELAAKLEEVQSGQIVQEIIETYIQPDFTFVDGQVTVNGLGANVIALVRVNEKTAEDRETTLETANAEARHILIGYQGADRAAEDLAYENAEAAKAKAEELLIQIKGGADFAQLAQKFSTGPTGANGGSLGEFSTGQMAPAFNDAVFDRTASGLVEEVIETSFGFHIIEVQSLTPAVTETKPETKVSYEIIGWDTDEYIWTPTALGGAQLEVAQMSFDEVGQALVNLQFTGEGGRMFGEITGTLAERQCGAQACRLGIRVGGNWVSRPTVSQKINSRQAQITGSFTQEQARTLANDLNLGAIDAPVILSGQTTVEAQLGQNQLQQSIQAASWGFLATMLFMAFIYRLPGIIAAVALSLYAGLFLVILKLWPTALGGPIVLSLSGAAGLALSIGLAVDGNILIFERLKEEIAKGRKLPQAIDLGFERAWSAIRDSNLTTLLSCTILFWLGSSVIKGFAVMLIIGTLLSMFTAITISRTLLRSSLLIPGASDPRLWGTNAAKTADKKSSGPKLRKRQKKS